MDRRPRDGGIIKTQTHRRHIARRWPRCAPCMRNSRNARSSAPARCAPSVAHFKLTGLTPYLTKGEALLARRRFVRQAGASFRKRSDGSCPLLHPESAAASFTRIVRSAVARISARRRRTLRAARRARSSSAGLEAVDAALGGMVRACCPGRWRRHSRINWQAARFAP